MPRPTEIGRGLNLHSFEKINRTKQQCAHDDEKLAESYGTDADVASMRQSENQQDSDCECGTEQKNSKQ